MHCEDQQKIFCNAKLVYTRMKVVRSKNSEMGLKQQHGPLSPKKYELDFQDLKSTVIGRESLEMKEDLNPVSNAT